MRKQMSQSLLEANGHLGAGRLQQARIAFETACLAAYAAGDVFNPLEWGAAILGFTSLVLGVGDWPLLHGKAPDELLLAAIESAESAQSRSRTLEGQLLMLRSQALFNKPAKTITDLDAAIEARHQAIGRLIEGAVEDSPWTLEQARSWLTSAQDEGSLLSTQLLDQERMQKHLETLAGSPADEDQFELLFSQWASPREDGTSMTVHDFAERFIEVASRLKRKVDKAPCSAPCEGGLPGDASVLEKELVALVARDGAGSWKSKAAELRMKESLKDHAENISTMSLQLLWQKLKPKLQKVIGADEQMSCGHSCSTCPTRKDCQVHDSLKDIEDVN